MHSQIYWRRILLIYGIQLNLSIKDTLSKGHLSNEYTVWSSSHIDLCTIYLLIRDSQLGHNGVLYREVPLYSAHLIE